MVQSLKYCLKSKLFWVYTALTIIALLKQFINESMLIDSYEYSKKASFLFDNWLSSKVEMNRFLEPLRRTLGYPMLIRMLFFSHFAIYILQMIVSLCIPVVLHKFCKHFQLFQNLWNVAMIMMLTYPLQFYYSAFLMPDLICQFLLLLYIYFYFEGHWKAIPLVLTLLILLKPVYLILIIVPFVLVPIKRYKLNLFDAIPLLIVLLISWIHFNQYAVFSYSTVGTTNAYDYNRKKTLLLDLTDNQVEEIYTSENKQLNLIKLDFKAQKEFMNAKTLPILMNPKYWVIHFKGVFVTLLDPGRYDAMVFLNWNKSSGFMGVNDGNTKKNLPWWQIVYMGVFSVLSILKLVFAVYAIFQWKRYEFPTLIGIFILLFAFIAGPVGCARYLLPLYPMMSFLAGLGCLTYLKNHSKIESFITQR